MGKDQEHCKRQEHAIVRQNMFISKDQAANYLVCKLLITFNSFQGQQYLKHFQNSVITTKLLMISDNKVTETTSAIPLML